MIIAAIVCSLLLGAVVHAIATHVGTTTRLAEAMAYGNTAEVAALHNLRLRGEDKAAAAKWLDAMAARDLLNRLEARMAENDEAAVQAILVVRGAQLPDELRDAVENWLDDGEDDDDDERTPPIHVPIAAVPSPNAVHGVRNELVFGNGKAEKRDGEA